MSFKEMTESEIIKKIIELMKKNGLYSDVVKQYFQEIYLRYYFQCYNISRYYGLNKQDSEDAVQESFIKLLKSIKGFDNSRPFKPWFFKVVLNSVKDKYNDNKKHSYTNIDYIEDFASNEQENIFEEFHMRDVFHSIIIKLPEKLKSVVVLRNYTDMNLEAISSVVGLSVRQLHNRLSKAYSMIKNDLEDKR